MKIPNPIKMLRGHKGDKDIKNAKSPVKATSPEDLEQMRHTLAHLLGAAVLELHPSAKRSIGPAIDNGFYYDFEFESPINNNDLIKIESKMRDLLKDWKDFTHRELDREAALAEYPSNEYKRELISEFTRDGGMVTFYKSGNFEDLCKGGHVENPSKDITPDAFRLTHIAGAYWRGNEKNKMLSRIYGLAFATKEELLDYEVLLEEAKKKDHRKLGKELGLFVFSDTVGKGLPLWTAKGTTIRRIIERFVVDEEIRRGYTHVTTPDIAKLELYKKSGHYPYYKDSMYAPIKIDDEEFMLRPMTCPHHFELYLSERRSYRDLPMRLAEIAKLYRYEQSGELTGLIRLRGFSLADAHIICADPNQAKEEVKRALDLIDYLAGLFSLKQGDNYWYRLSLGNRENTEKYYDDSKAWDVAEAKLREVLEERNADYVSAPDEAAFYGPKIDIQMKNVLGKEDTAFTVQYDFVMPSRFNLTFVNKEGQDEPVPAVIHRSSIGAIERIIGFLIEHYSGNFPTWLAPVQVRILPITDTQKKFSEQIFEELIKSGARVELDTRAESLGKKIRDAKLEKIPYLLVIGDKELKDETVTVESRDSGKVGEMKIADFLIRLKSEIPN